MDVLKNIINNLSKDEIRYYKLHTKLSHSKIQKKQIKLFDLIREKKIYSQENACELLSKNKRNNFYQLRNKVLKGINKSLNLQHMHKEKDLYLFNYILLSIFIR